MSKERLVALAALMDAFARKHWQDAWTDERGQLGIDGDLLSCVVNGERVEGKATAPLLFVSGAWALIFAHEGAPGHRIAGHFNRIWPNGAGQPLRQSDIDGEVVAWSKLWPERLFSSELYRGVETPGHPHWPNSLEGAPRSTSLAGIMKRAAKSFDDDDPLERLKVAEFVLYNIEDWSSTDDDLMMGAIGKPLLALAADTEPAIREVALLALEMCAFRLWHQRAYTLYEPLCCRLIDAGLNIHLQYARLAESEYASGDRSEGDRLWALGSDGVAEWRTVKLGSAYDHVGDWGDLRTRILRQAGGANVAYALGNDPNPARHAKKAKKGIKPAEPEAARKLYAIARPLLAEAAKCADARLAIDLPAIKAGKKVPLGSGEIDPAERRLYLSDIFGLQAILAQADGDLTEQRRLLFKSVATDWALEREERIPNSPDLESALELARGQDLDEMRQLGMPAFLEQLLADQQKTEALGETDHGREQLFWRSMMMSALGELLESSDADSNSIQGEQLVAEMVFERNHATLTVRHPALGAPVCGSVATPILTLMRVWNSLLMSMGSSGVCARLYGSYFLVLRTADDVALAARIASELHEAGLRDEAISLYRMACGTDATIKPWPYRDPIDPFPLHETPDDVRTAVGATSRLEADGGFDKLKPRGRRVEQLAAVFDADDAVSARYIGQCLRDACAANDSEIVRVLKTGPALLERFWAHSDPSVREAAILPTCALLNAWAIHAPKLDAGSVRERLAESGAVDMRRFSILDEDVG